MVVVVVPFVVVVVLSTGAAAGIRIVELLLPVSTTTCCPCLSSTQTSPTTPHSPSEGLSFSLDASLFPMDYCTLYVCVECDRRMNETPAHKI